MTGNVATGSPDALLKRIISEKRQRLRKNVHILFLGLTAAEADPIITLLRGARLAPRGKQVQSADEFTAALSERAWDLILSPQAEGHFAAKEAIQILTRLNKDIPVIQLVPRSTSQSLLQGLKARMATVISLEEQELLLIQIRRQLEHLENRRRMRQAEAHLAEAEKQCLQLARISELPIIYLNADLNPLFSNPAFHDLFGLEQENLHGQGLDKFIAMKDREQLRQQLEAAKNKTADEIRIELNGRRIDGSNFLASFRLQHARYQNQDCVQVIIEPDSNIKQQTFENLDPITRLYDKQFMLSKLEKAVHKALPGGADCNLLYIKFDNHSTLLSELGSKGCDIVMADLAELLRNKINKAHICARLDDGVFAILFHDPSPDKAVKLAELLRRAIAEIQFTVTGTTVQTTCSIGVCTINDNAPHYIELLDRAKVAAEDIRTKDRNGNGVKLYELKPEIDEVAEDDSAVQLIRDALANDKFRILFQPVVGLSSANGLGNYEVFLRLHDEENKEGISPNVFLTTLDNAETSISMDKWVIEKAFCQVADKLKEQQRSRVFINLTTRSFQNSEMLIWLQDQLKQHRIPADLIVFQISESDMTTHLAQAQNFVLGVRKLGCKICIKHFGISEDKDALRRKIKPELIKLDGSFIQDLSDSPAADKHFAAMIKMIKESGIQTIAPMVEDTRLMGKLWKLGIDYVQGYYLQPPGPEMNYDFFE
ncbi:EAL domain-containing protein [Amphritea sp. HPY]|uniref:EAL domain-containing protein n=1 Tax=Amphritea sp. HPY TaxID=3421652 RepID=UPI003D7D13C2